MYEIFGEFNSAEEINAAAVGLLNEGDKDNILVLAKENGLDIEFAKAFIDGEIPVLTDVMGAAIGKIEVERKEIKEPFFEQMKDDMINYLLTSCTDETFAQAIRMKGKSLKECFAYCKSEITKALRSKSGALRDPVVYAMQKKYYMRKEAVKVEEETIREDTDSETETE